MRIPSSPPSSPTSSLPRAPLPAHVRVAIIGAGFGGLGTAIRLRQEGIEDFAILERGPDLGGVWRDNTYPGCACDVQSHLYSFSFALNPRWTRSYSGQPEILAYLQGCADRFGVRPHLHLDCQVQDATWDEAAQLWRLRTSRGQLTCEVLVAGAGALSEPALPTLPGLLDFDGKVMHSARWDHQHPLAGRKVAVIGTGASAIQLVPVIQREVAELVLFQRTPPWVIPRGDRAISPGVRRLFEAVPAAQRVVREAISLSRELLVLGFRHPRVMHLAERVVRRHLRQAIADDELRRKLTPRYTLGCKRVLISDDYLPALTQPNVKVVTEAIREVRARSIVDAAGVEHPVDTIVLATGFQVTEPPIAAHVRGRGGRTLADVWQGSPEAHLGTTVAGFPNYFMLSGPNTGLGHSSMILMIEAQVEHLLGALRHMRSHSVRAIEPTAAAQEAFVASCNDRMRGTVWTSGGCSSWYLDRTGRNSTLWPGATLSFRRRVGRFDPREYREEALRDAAASEERGDLRRAG
ncbi:MAG: NAD(P)/FAD-dependent oxidoreductase [Polyangiaceae bacterium]